MTPPSYCPLKRQRPTLDGHRPTQYLRAVEIPQSPLGDEASRVEQLVYDTLGAGLQIVDIVPFDPR
jgi:hypothetical protein